LTISVYNISIKLEGRNMTLPKVKRKKLINQDEFVKNAKRVQKSLEEELNYLREKKQKDGDNTSSQLYFIS